MNYKILTVIIVFFFSSCDKISKKNTSLYDLIPENSEFVISIKNLSKFKSSITNNDYLKTVINSNLTVKNLISQLDKINDDTELLIGFYDQNDTTHYNIIGRQIHNDSIGNLEFSFENIDIITSNSNYKPKVNNDLFVQKFKKINQTNTNFSIALDSLKTKEFFKRVFKNEVNISDGNLIINIDASNNLIYINGVVDNYSLNSNSNYKKISVEEIIENEEKLYFDFKNDLLTDYDIISTNQENKFDFFQLDSTDAVLDLYKIFQLKEGNNLASINGVISNYRDDSKNSEIELKFETSISNEIILGPLIVKNHTNNKNEVFVQDSENIIYLINDNGQIEWTKKINDRVIDEVKQIDSYKNGRLQYVFATQNSLHVIDRKGRDVGKFPLKFNDQITKPVSVFDYDNNKNYRLLITQNDELFMFDSKGNRVRGFDYNKKSKIITKPEHFRISNKDIIVFKTSDDLKILNRRGKVRIKINEDYNYSKDEIFQYQNSLLTTTVDNNIVKIDMNGNSKEVSSMSFNGKYVSDKKTIYTLQKNILSNSKKNIEIQFGKYENFSAISDKKNTLINIYDSQNNKLYLFDDEINTVKGFPILADTNASFILENNKIEFCVISDSKKIKYFLLK
ncbi:MAG: hypothetical protein ACJ0O7_04085 [Flavobacteriaceae bacterium]|tara:strand:- start:3308 stop:5176 length:1869 start_codon:yes stop_codon:yes gene_type:complete